MKDMGYWVRVVAFVALALALVLWSTLEIVKWECEAHGEITGRESKTQSFNCYENVDGQWELVKRAK